MQTTLTVGGAVRARDAVARALYAHLFEHLVELVNGSLATADGPAAGRDGSASSATKGAVAGSLGLLDIFGFERLETNSLEQLLINYANERLHAYFLSSVFDSEVRAYAAEGVPWPDVAVPEHGEIVSLLETAPLGLLPLLDDQCALPSPSDDAFSNAAVQAHTRSAVFARPKQHRRRRRGGSADSAAEAATPSCDFVLHHFAGTIKYSCQGFVERNADRLPSDALAALSRSTDPLISSLFAHRGGGLQQQRARRAATTVSAAFSQSLRELIDALQATRPYFVRCVRPRGGVHSSVPSAPSGGGGAVVGGSAAGSSSGMDGPVVLGQLHALGVLEAVALMTLGFPTRIPYKAVHARYGSALPAWAAGLPPRELTRTRTQTQTQTRTQSQTQTLTPTKTAGLPPLVCSSRSWRVTPPTLLTH